MAGVLKPSGVKGEGSWVVNAFSASGYPQKDGLFDGKIGEYNGSSTFYWSDANCYLDITFNQKTNIWALSHNDYPLRNANFTIQKWNGISWVSFSIIQNTRSDVSNIWTKVINEMPQGRYRFSGFRMDAEWYLELPPINKYLIQNKNNLFKVEDEEVTDLGVVTPTEDLFKSQGMDEIPFFTELMITQLGNCKVLKWTDNTNDEKSLTLVYGCKKYIPLDKIQDEFDILEYIE
ncbi:hypothetical protein [Clostridium tagluense]|uniref:Uncharacterized protein n=1 Tax=Clostridium tagluense TaxID=360422 RepID=A0A401UQF3_9CLOT|nr:hypothetical protein [Clostridium tagluense]GCD11782.1 hypothetical protein Ctaglu_34050 [Clostridium tagluense]